MKRIHMITMIAALVSTMAQAATIQTAPNADAPNTGAILIKGDQFAALSGDDLAPGKLFYTESILAFPEWQQKYPAEAELLIPYAGFKEPMLHHADGDAPELVRMYVARTKTVLNVRATQVDPAKFLTMENLGKLDPEVRHKQIGAADLIFNEVGVKKVENFNWCNDTEISFTRPQQKQADMSYLKGQPFCAANSGSLCVESCYVFKGGLRDALSLASATESDDNKHDLGIASQSELRAYNGDKDLGGNLAEATHISTSVAAVVTQNIIYFDQVFLFAKIVSVVQPHPTDSSKSVLTTFVGLGVLQRSWLKYGPGTKETPGSKIGIALSYVGKDLPHLLKFGLKGYTSGLAAGVPTYSQNMTKAIASLLDGTPH